MAPPSKTTSKPGRALFVLAALLVVMLIGIIGPTIGNPARWGHAFRVGLGLDLTSGTQATLQAIPPKGKSAPSSTQMKEAVAIMLSRVNGSGNTGAQVQQMGNDLINVTVPGQGSQQVINEVSTTAQLRFRPVLLEAVSTAGSASPTPSPSPTTTPSRSATPSPRPSATTRPSAKATTKALIRGVGRSATDRVLVTADRRPAASPTASPTPTTRTASASASPAPTPSSSASPSAAASSSSSASAFGNASLVTPSVLKLFDKLNCADKNWKSQIGYTEQIWDDPNTQIVACGTGSDTGIKYALGKAVVLGTDVTSANAGLDSTSNQWVVNLTLNGKATKAFAALTSNQYSKYYSGAQSGNQNDVALDETAIVLDGNVVSAPETQQSIPGGQVMITGLGGEQQATQLADELKYGALPLTFKLLDTSSVSPQLGKNQLNAGLIAAAIGLALVVLYSILYYRGLAVVSVFSLATSAVLVYLSVVLLTRYQHFTLSLAGIAGLIVAIGITADSFVVFFERLRDEVREGRTLRAAVESGWKRARRTILVSDTVSFLAALLLYIFAIGDVKGFAYTLGLTTIIDVVVVFLFTKPMVTLLARTDFYGRGRRGSGLDPARLGARTPWRSAPEVRGVRGRARPRSTGTAPTRTGSREA